MHRCEICGYDNSRATCQGPICIQRRAATEAQAQKAGAQPRGRELDRTDQRVYGLNTSSQK